MPEGTARLIGSAGQFAGPLGKAGGLVDQRGGVIAALANCDGQAVAGLRPQAAGPFGLAGGPGLPEEIGYTHAAEARPAAESSPFRAEP